jgi:hypothetical protein
MSDFISSFPNSKKILVDGAQGVQVPMREIALEQGASSLRVYDTSGPQGHDVARGLPKLREPWVNARLKPSRSMEREPVGERNGRCVTQLHYARKGEITPEMEFIAVREGAACRFRPRGSGARTRDHSGQHPAPRAGADDHRAQFPGEDQRQHRQLGGVLVD